MTTNRISKYIEDIDNVKDSDDNSIPKEYFLNEVVTLKDITKEECPYLTLLGIKKINKNTTLYRIIDIYNICSPDEVPVTLKYLEYPYFGISRDLVEDI